MENNSDMNTQDNRFQTLSDTEIIALKKSVESRLYDFEQYLDGGYSLALFGLEEYQALCRLYTELEAVLNRNRG